MSPATRQDDHRRAARGAAAAGALAAQLAQARRLGAFPGAYAAVGDRRGLLAEAAVGAPAWGEPGRPDAQTVWDLASLTKVVALTPVVMRLEAAGRLGLDDPVGEHLPEWQGARHGTVRVRHLLAHSAGLPAWRPWYRGARSPAEMRARVLAEPTEAPPGARYVYSDAGAMLLGFVAEQAAGAPLDELVAMHVLRPLGLQRTGYCPSIEPAGIAPTEFDAGRGRLLRGEVHDENARALGGVSGHAGLFGCGADLARFATAWLADGRVDGRAWLPTDSIARFSTVENRRISHRALGWETAHGAASAGQLLSADAVGHTGFTGTSLWIDPRQDVFVLLLSNRVCRSRENRRILSTRPALHDAVLGALHRAGAPARSAPAAPSLPPPASAP